MGGWGGVRVGGHVGVGGGVGEFEWKVYQGG